MNFTSLEEAVIIKAEELERMKALAARQGAPLSDGQRRACLERMLDRMAAARALALRLEISTGSAHTHAGCPSYRACSACSDPG